MRITRELPLIFIVLPITAHSLPGKDKTNAVSAQKINFPLYSKNLVLRDTF
jgi:hypothetical protein